MKTIEYIRPDVVVCLNGDIQIPEKGYEQISWVAADGAANILIKKNIVPSYIVGDMDSVETKYLTTSVYKKVHEQQTNDFEKVLMFVKDKGWKKIAIMGFQGKDIDHTLNNWSIVMKYGKLLQLCIVDNNKCSIPLYSDCQLPYQKGLLVSLIPQPMVNITTIGLEWELQNGILELGKREGARNRATSENVYITIHSGSVLLVIEDVFPGLIPIPTTILKNSDK